MPACAGVGQGKSEFVLKSVEELQTLQTELKTAINSQIGDATCEKNDDCRVLAIGANPCGGSETYLAYSLVDTDVESLKNLAEKYKAVRKTLHAKSGTVGTCVVMPQPQVQCQKQHCITIPRPGAVIY